MEPDPIDVFRYLDYRAFLRDFYDAKKSAGRGFSYRAFSRKAGLKSPNYLKLVMDGQRNLTPQMAERFGKTCGLDADGLGYFVDLVAFNQASTSATRNNYYSRLTSFREYKKTHALDIAHAAYASTWYMPVIRELATRADFSADPAWIAKTLLPPISKAEASKALQMLLEMGLLAEEDGRIVRTQALVSTGPQTSGLHMGNYHRCMMDRAAEAIDTIPAGDRDISSLTLCVGAEGIRNLKERIKRFRRELLELSELEDEPHRVVQINFQLFPLSVGQEES